MFKAIFVKIFIIEENLRLSYRKMSLKLHRQAMNLKDESCQESGTRLLRENFAISIASTPEPKMAQSHYKEQQWYTFQSFSYFLQ